MRKKIPSTAQKAIKEKDILGFSLDFSVCVHSQEAISMVHT